RRRKTINKEKVERLKYFGTRLVRSQQEYFNSISSLHQIPNVPAAMPIAAQSGESSPKPPLLYERLLPFMAKRRLESRTSLTNSHHKPTYETSGVLISQQASDPVGSSSQRRLTVNVVSPSSVADQNH
uniref:Uncharacterized protein n=1 Tax=Parascaris univalens TaxID=6257 RepID=A0A915AJM3_PARUN